MLRTMDLETGETITPTLSTAYRNGETHDAADDAHVAGTLVHVYELFAVQSRPRSDRAVCI